MVNRLAHETSPYLLQHKDNPVDWYPWGDEALERARTEDRPILLSIGYSACHWCHVMERESFENPAIAAQMNESFVCVKVDREQRPDLDSIYMEAVQAMTGQGGWPMTVFLTPDERPFYGGTYFPPEDRHGLPGFPRLLEAVADAWANRRGEVDAQSQDLVAQIGSHTRLSASDEPVSEQLLTAALEAFERGFDPEFGGFGGAPKFPQPMNLDALLRMSTRGMLGAGAMVKTTLDAMAGGGMFDQLRGGFARYSVDQTWTVPHFEKMLYDNAQLLRTYARSYAATGDERHRDVAVATANWILDEMRSEDGGFFCALDADSEGEEGRFYVWDLEEVRDAAGADADAAIAAWGITAAGNFEGKSIPIHTGWSADLAAVERARGALLEVRSRRTRPSTDDKILTGWNALACSALAESGAMLGHTDWIEAAETGLRFALDTLRVDGRLMRSYREGRATHLGVCEDYAFTVESGLALFQATGEMEWLDLARWAATEAVTLFLDPAGGFFTTGSDAEQLITRPKELVDNAIPSATSVLALELQKLALITGEDAFAEHARNSLRLLAGPASRSPLAFGHLLQAIDFYVAAPVEIVIIGEPSAPDTTELLSAVRTRFLPNAVLVTAPDAANGVPLPLLEGRATIEGRATAFVCRRGVCKLPVTSVNGLLEQLQPS